MHRATIDRGIDADAPPNRVGRVDVLVTAGMAYPVFERLVLAAEREIVAGFRIFDMRTKLRSAEGLAVGEDWFDLLLHVARRGVAINLLMSDFDAVVGTELHGLTWETMRQGAALAELARQSNPDARVRVHASLHPAEVGWAARLMLWPRVDRLLRDKAARLLRLDEPRRARFLQGHPHLSRLLMVGGGNPGPRRWPLPPLAPVTHHQKVAVLDGETVYVGGLDLNERRWDTPDHARPAPETWHDVQVLRRDPVAAGALRTHLVEMVDVIHRRAEPSPMAGGILRTLSAKRRSGPLALSPKPKVAEIREAILAGIAEARDVIYLETQFLRDRRVAGALARAARRRPGLNLVILLPARPEDVAFEASRRSDARFGEFLQTLGIRRIRKAYRGRVFIGALARPVTAQGSGNDVLHGAPIVYLHSKVSVFDDRLAIVGSANLNGRSLTWDTEVAIALRDPAEVRAVRDTCMGAVLALDPVPEAFHAAGQTASAWQRLALGNARKRPEERQGFVVPYLARPGARFGRRLPSVPEEMV